MMVDLTVAICTYNGETRLPRVLDRLLIQTQTEQFSWEVLVIDNNSTDNTAKIIAQYQSIWPKAYPVQYYFEAQQGLAFARRLAIKKAQGELVAFLDDDNLPTPSWVWATYSFGQRHPRAGAYGSQIEGEYEINPPKNFHQIACFLAVIDRGQEPFRYDLLIKWLFPAGAGLVVRKQAWLESVPEHPLLSGVSGNTLSDKGEDIETLTYIRIKGWEIWHNPEMKIFHYIPKSRLEKSYLIQLFRGVGLNRYPLRMLRLNKWQKFGMSLFYLANDFCKFIFFYYRYSQLITPDIVDYCQFELFKNSLLSPFYYWQKNVKSIKFKNILNWVINK